MTGMYSNQLNYRTNINKCFPSKAVAKIDDLSRSPNILLKKSEISFNLPIINPIADYLAASF
jgi:hypothetical protein